MLESVFPTRNGLLKDYSVHDVLWTLSKIYVVELEGARVLNEIPKSVEKLLEKLEVDILPEIKEVSDLQHDFIQCQ
ncbi:MAG: hypothetical protein QXJ27_02225 [Thermoplasmata archaeon]